MATLLIIDDHPMARLAIRMLLEKDGHHVLAESGDGSEAFKLIQKLMPEIVVVDLDIPGLSGVELIEKLRSHDFAGRLLVLTGRDDEHYLSRCMNSGADGFVGKGNNLDELQDAVRAVERGYGYFPLRRQTSTKNARPAGEVEAVKRLSNRELQVLRYLSRGVKVMDISEKMHISNKTVSTYKTRLMTKLQVSNTMELIDFARRHSLD
ncbi:Virulence factors putative positive transcription regulator BvgA [Cedecea neteri]|uniref:DNA-binding response regulator n=1 Tax=Cedecea neteri TaxID=158822 RepID=A0A291DZ17_9ENTR|nr:response regulator [Cedecea neteri]ATF92953.1 DNA-binding response regulator [Cedecea neteri]SQC93221.1 Virulence factors putative positive transcription regulator BvgA [Cedecea neteri]